ncbi:MAG: inorganic phosphate transporter [Haliscomenobacter sp.]|nr:inorganic phosphate transporter [Haliscomenobacter sp.]
MSIFFFFVIVLFALAATDLIVGVANDAVNFLNSAIGSKAGSRRTIMIVASFGVFFGALFAGGMMEVARKGIFNPEFFTFAEVMVIFMAVMFTDIVLLDFFNTFGLPTSTTVSIVFELLGASVAMAAFKVLSNGEGLGQIGQYINSENALTIITGIFVSVGVAFTVGMLVQYLARLIFSFDYQRRLKTVGVIWAGISLTAISYFLLFKGLKGASFVSGDFLHWVEARTGMLMLGTFLFWSVLMFLILQFTKVNILRIVVLAGTFALAMAFASNDLVNFIGPSVAGFESYRDWMRSGADANSYLMESLAAAYPANTYMLLPAGLIMVITLWLSKKARTVTDTEVSLGRQSEGLERFNSNLVARWLVRTVTGLNAASAILPNKWKEKIESRFRVVPINGETGVINPNDAPAFDLVRASVNLTVSSVLIAFATSMKLPLSTTYVTFMVAMGSSLSDGAWGRDNAVFRVSGVVSVLLGWFLTAFIAFAVSGFFAAVMATGGLTGVFILIGLVVMSFYYTFVIHRKREQKRERLLEATRKSEIIPARQIIHDTAQSIGETMKAVGEAYQISIRGLSKEDRAQLRKAKAAMGKVKTENEEFRYAFYGSMKRVEEELAEGSRTYLLAYDLMQDFIQSASLVADAAREHVEDVLAPLEKEQQERLEHIAVRLNEFLDKCILVLQTKDFGPMKDIKQFKKSLLEEIEQLLALQTKGIKEDQYSPRNCILFFSILLETKDLVAVAARFVKMYYRLEHEHSPEEPWVLVSGK